MSRRKCEHCGIGEREDKTRCGVCGWPGEPLDLDKDAYHRAYLNSGAGDVSPDGRRLESDPFNYLFTKTAENAKK